MTKLTKMFLVQVIALALTACGSNGGSGGDSSGGGNNPNNPSGFATFQNLSSGSSNNVCFKSSGTFGTAGSCSVAGTPSNQYSNAFCSAGTAKVTCTVRGQVFNLTAAGGNQADTACVNEGGSIAVSCPILTQGTCQANGGVWTAPTSPNITGATNCAANGGTYYATLNRLMGSFNNQSFVPGINRVTADPNDVATALGLFNGVYDLDNTNMNLVAMTATLTIDDKWDSAVVLNPSIYNMTYNAVDLNVVSSAGTTSFIQFKDNTVVLYFH